MDPKEIGSSRLSTERRLHAIVCGLERVPELKNQYHKKTRVVFEGSAKFLMDCH